MRLFAAAAFAALIYVQPAAAETILDTDGVIAAKARGAILWDVRSEAAFKKGHIPGAVSIGEAGQTLRDPNTEDYIAIDKIAKILGDAGIDPAKEVVVYGGAASPVAYFGLLTLQYFGGKQAKIYHEGIDGWTRGGGKLSAAPVPLPPVTLELKPESHLTLSTAEMIQRAKSGKSQILDARTPKEYSGEDVRALRGGHIPGAINIPYEQNWVDPETPRKLAKKEVANNAGMKLKTVDELRALYSKLDPAKETVVYCQSGVRAAETATVLKELGFKDVKVYDSSWLGYGNTLDAPAERVSYFNVNELNGKVGALAARVEQLEKALAEATAKLDAQAAQPPARKNLSSPGSPFSAQPK